MERKKINLQGIVRAFPDNISEDGALHECINLRKYKGGFRTIGDKELLDSTTSSGRHFIHKTKNGKEYIWYSNSGVLTYEEVGSDDANATTVNVSTDTVRFSAVHNVLMYINETDEEIGYFIYDMDNDEYDLVGTDRFPDLIKLEMHAGVESLDTTNGYITDYNVDGMDATEREEAASGLFNKVEANLNENGKFSGYTSYIFAYEMYDGTIIKQSAPKLIKHGSWRWTWQVGDDEINVYSYNAPAEYRCLTSNYNLGLIRSTYGNIIKSVNIYMTRPIHPYNIDWDDVPTAPTVSELTEKEYSDIQKDVITKQSYYLIKSINLDDLSYSTSYTAISLGDVTDLSTREALPIDSFTHHDIYGECDFNYNGRFWLANIKTNLFKGYDPDFFVIADSDAGDTGTNYDVYFEVEIKEIDGTKTVRSDSYTVNYYDSTNIHFMLRDYFSYPDGRASKLRILVDDGTTVYKAGEYNLTKHPYLNFAYLLWGETDTIDEGDFTSSSLATVSDQIIDTNRIQASYLDNPFYFPAENSYRAGNDSVIALSANTLTVSEGQFGQYPVYAFTSSGVYILSIAGGDILVDRVVPLSRDVISSKDSLCNTDYGVVFATDNNGVMIASGSKIDKLSFNLEGDYAGDLSDNSNRDNIITNANIADVEDYICTEDALTYFDDVKIGYDYIRKEVIISNSDHNFSWHFNFQSQAWFKSSLVFTSFLNYFPDMIGIIGTSLYKLSSEDWSSTTHKPVYIETKPIKLTIDGLKKIERLAGRGIFETSSSKSMGIYLFGSIDRDNWNSLGISRVDAGTFTDIMSQRSPYSAREFIVIISGTLNEDSILTHLDCVYKNKFNNRLR